MYNIVTNSNIIHLFKNGSKLFKTELGKNNIDKTASEQHAFGFHNVETFKKTYYDKFHDVLQQNGSIGSIKFYTNNAIKDSIIQIFDDDNKLYGFLLKDSELFSRGIDSIFADMLKQIEDGTYTNPLKKEQEIINTDTQKHNKDSVLKEVEENYKEAGNPDKVLNNPGFVTFEDVKEYLKKYNKTPKTIKMS